MDNNIFKCKCKSKHLVLLGFSAILIVSAHSFVEVSCAGDEIPKFSGSTVDSGNGVVKPMKVFFIPVLIDGEEASKFINNGRFEFRSGVPLFSGVGKKQGESVADQRADQRPYDGEPSSNNCYFVGTKFQFFASLFIGGITGLLISVAIIFLFFFYTQRRAGRDRCRGLFCSNRAGIRRITNAGEHALSPESYRWRTLFLTKSTRF